MDFIEFREAVVRERARRLRLKAENNPYIYWKVRDDADAPRENHWCEFCAGFFGVRHDNAHTTGQCRFLYRAWQDQRQCACIECTVAEDSLRAQRSN